MLGLIQQKDQHSPKSERGTDVLPRFALGCSAKGMSKPTTFITENQKSSNDTGKAPVMSRSDCRDMASAQHIKRRCERSDPADEGVWIPNGKGLVMTFETHAATP
jgi:hypothetical protein